MKHEIIKTDNYLLIVDDSEIKEGNWVFNNISKEIYQFIENYVPYEKKIIAHLPINDSSILEGVAILPPFEDEVVKLASEWNTKEVFTSAYSFTVGYNKAKEKYKYTEEDMMEAILQISEYYAYNIGKDLDPYKKALDIIQSLQQPKMPVEFECEMVNCDKCVYVQGGNLSPDCCNEFKQKTITNSQSQTMWVGKYIY